jgi:hypothetical protein
MEARAEFREAARDCRLLLDRGYSARPVLALVGDRRRLTAEERLILFRGVASSGDSARRRAGVVTPGRAGQGGSQGVVLLLDAYNVAFIIVHYLVGKPCFISTDGLLRDAGANYGRVPRDELLSRAFSELAAAAARLGLTRVEAFLDAPVPHSGAHAGELRAAFAAAGIEASVELAKSADGAILARSAALSGIENAGAFVASGDSVLADSVPLVFDLARFVLEEGFHAELLDLSDLLP